MVDLAREKDLLQRIQAGDLSACDECVEMHSPNLIRLAVRMVQDEGDAEDVVQEAFLNAFKNIRTFDGRSRLGTWLFRITYNTALMHLRKKKPAVIPVEDQDGSRTYQPAPAALLDWCCLPENDYLKAEALAEISRAVETLPASLQEVFIMREFEGLTTREVAGRLGISPGAVKVRLHRARLTLRDRLVAYFGDRIAFGERHQ